MLEASCEINFKEPETVQEIQNQILWANSLIRINNKPVVWATAMQQIKHIKDLISPDNMIYSFTQFTAKYGNCIYWLNYYSVITAIPKTWLEMLFITHATPENAFLYGYYQLYQFQSISKKADYRYITNHSFLPKYCARWFKQGSS